MIKESGIMAEIHKIRERFYQKTKNIDADGVVGTQTWTTIVTT